MRNTQLHEAIKEYCKAALALLRGRVTRSEDLPTTIKKRVEIRGTTISGFYDREIQWFLLISRNEELFKQSPSYQQALRALDEDNTVAKHLNTLVGTPEGSSRIDRDNLPPSILTILLEEQQGMDFQDDVFDRIYTELEDFFYQDILEYRYLTVLEGFKMEAERLELGPTFSIIRIPSAEREEILSRPTFIMMPFSNQAAFHEYGLELLLTVPKLIGDPPQQPYGSFPTQTAREKFEEVTSALRLFKVGGIGFTSIRYKGTNRWALGGGFIYGPAASYPLHGPGYLLSESEIQPFTDFWQFYQQARRASRNRIDIALRRLNFGYER